MLLGIHFLSSGAVAASLTQNSLVAFSIGFIVHHLADYLPHLDTNIFTSKKYFSLKDFNSSEDYKKIGLIITEFIIFILIFFYFMGNKSLEIQKIAVWGGIGGLFPDLINFLNIILANRLAEFTWFRKYQLFHRNFHFRGKNKLFALFVQFCFFLLTLILMLGL